MRLTSLFSRACRWVLDRLRGLLPFRPSTPRRYELVYADEVPESVGPHTIIAVGEGVHLWYAVFACPCGCGELVQLSLLPDERPRWRLTVDGTVPTLSPSIWRRRGCRSHFFLRNGLVLWCSPTSDSVPDSLRAPANRSRSWLG